MNIFYLAEDFEENTRYHVDRHAVKMTIEYAQILSTAWNVLERNQLPGMYDTTHVNHPCCVWAREDYENMRWLATLGNTLRDEYVFRYDNPQKMLQPLQIFQFTLNNVPRNIAQQDKTKFRCAIPETSYISDDPIDNYRHYYNNDKRHLFFLKSGAHCWKKRSIPSWITNV